MKQTNIKKNRSKQNGRGQFPSFLQKFFVDQLKDMHYAENELLKGLEEMKNASSTEELQDAFDDHIKQTQRHVQRLEKVFRMIGKEAESETCEAMDGLLRECRDIISETEDGSLTRDAALIVGAQKIEHYEMATYGGLVALARTMNLDRAADLLDKTLQEEEETDAMLTEIAEAYINVEAEQEGDYVWEKQGQNEKVSASAF